MRIIQYKNLLQLAFILIMSVACSESGSSQSTEEAETESGISYQFVKHGTGEVPPDGGFWRMNLAYYDFNGTKLFSSEDRGGAMPMNYMSTNLLENASIEECFKLIGRGDSAVFYLSADSLFKNSYGRPTPPDMVGTKIKLCVGIEDVYSAEQFDNYTKEVQKEQIGKEDDKIAEYLKQQGITASKTDEGVYYQIIEPGSGEKPLVGQRVMVNYTGRNLDGTVFDSSVEEVVREAGLFNPQRQYGAIGFALGQGEVIRGWDIGIGLLAPGGKAKLIIPSPLAYGTQAMGAAIKPNSILVFDVELVEIIK
jgi:FKBP-type peptidyl-prolyl cis-trans isomerase FkpA